MVLCYFSSIADYKIDRSSCCDKSNLRSEPNSLGAPGNEMPSAMEALQNEEKISDIALVYHLKWKCKAMLSTNVNLSPMSWARGRAT